MAPKCPRSRDLNLDYVVVIISPPSTEGVVGAHLSSPDSLASTADFSLAHASLSASQLKKHTSAQQQQQQQQGERTSVKLVKRRQKEEYCCTYKRSTYQVPGTIQYPGRAERQRNCCDYGCIYGFEHTRYISAAVRAR